MRSRHQLRAHFLWLETLPKLHSLKNSVNSHLVYSSTGDSHTFCTDCGLLLYTIVVDTICSRGVYMRVMADEIVHLRVPDKIYKKLKKIADEEKRPVANLLRYILIKFAEGSHASR